MIKQWVLAASIIIGTAPVLADQTSIVVPETADAFTSTYHVDSNLDNIIHYAINPALQTVASNFAGASCAGITSPVPWQWCIDTTARKVRLRTPDSGGNFAFHDAMTVQADGSITMTSVGGTGAVTSVAGRAGDIVLSVADISGALAAANPTFTGNITASTPGGGFIGGYGFLQGSGPGLYWYIYGGGADSKEWSIEPDPTKLHLSLWNDAQTVRTDWLTVTRSGMTPTNITLGAPLTGPSLSPHVATNAALQAFTSYTAPVVRDAYTTLGDKGSATFVHSGTACSTADNGNQVTAADGGCWLNQSLELTPEMYGGGNNATGAANVAAFNAAMATGKSVICDGTYTITDRIIGVRNGALGGKTRNREGCVFAVDAATFNMSAKAVIQTCPQGGYEPGPYLHDFTITFVQPDTAVKASLNQYPPAINSDTDLIYPGTGSVCARWRANNIKITKAWNAIDMRGNSGGVNIDGVEISAFNIGFRIDGAFDITRIANVHWWPFGGLSGTPMTTNQSTVFKSSSNAFEIGRVDGMTLTNCVMLGGLGLNFITSTRSTGGAWVMMNGGGFDQNSGISMLVDSTFQGTNVYFTPSSLTTDYAINQSNGRVLMSTSTIFATTAATNAPVRVSGGKFQFSDGWIDTAGVDKSSIVQTDGFMQISNTSFQRNSNTAYTAPTINLSVVNARASIMGNRTEDKGTGAGTFINVTADNFNRIIGNVGVGWTNTFPTAVNGVYSLN